MPLNNENQARPGFDAAAASSQNSANARPNREAFAQNSTETDDFGAFRDEPTRTQRPKRGQRTRRTSAPQGNARRPFYMNRTLIIALAAALVAVLLLVLVVVLVVNSSSDIRYTDNTYISYVDNDGNYRIASNGTEIAEVFEGETTIVPSLDRSFAYVETVGEEGYITIYLLRNNKLQEIAGSDAEITSVLAYADTTPGVVFAEDNDVFLYNEDVHMGRITDIDEDTNLDSCTFLISGDAKTIIYTLPQEDNASQTTVWCYRNLRSESLRVNNHTPVALSADGTYLYVVSNGSRKLSLVHTEDLDKRETICEGNFGGITAINAKGDEILFYTNPADGSKMSAAVYSVKKNTVYEIATGKGIFVPCNVDAKVARYATFADMYFQSYKTDDLLNADNAAAGCTYYLNNKFEPQPIANAIGKFSSNGKYFYYISVNKARLYQIELSKLEDGATPLSTLGSVESFEITAKNNLYVKNTDGALWFFNPSNGKSERIEARGVEEMSMHLYANKLYYSVEDMGIFVTEEGSKKKVATLDKITPTALPVFINTESKKTFAYFYDDENGYNLLYTSNGSSFKVATDNCAEIAQSGSTSWLDIIRDMLDSIVSGSTNTNTSTNTNNGGNATAEGGLG